jgi:hypothetical protein
MRLVKKHLTKNPIENTMVHTILLEEDFPVAATITNALHDATGIRFTELPFTAEKICLALKKKEKLTSE